ncbi:MAG: InlB B-repeat-containing protein [Candidatus Izemoplasmatales bacterium]|jgi:hypothetical protein|nr:InlB B-repeat-containing protein [Candidatus Izemoplasmatales bacterium]
MKIKKTIILTFLIVVTSLLLIGCQDKKAYNDAFTVIFYTGLDTTNVVSSRIDPIIDVEYGDHVVKPEDPVANGAQFLGWYKEKQYINEWDFENDIVERSTVLYSKWAMLDMSITYVFDAAGGAFIDEPIYTFNVLHSLILPKADRLGSLFLGWILTPVEDYKVGNKIVSTTGSFSSDTILYALFENKEYTIRFKSLSTEVSNPKTYVIEYASPMDFQVLPDTATKTFVGWFSYDGTETGDWGFQYINGEIYLGKALSYDSVSDTWEFLPQGITLYAKWADK